MNWKIIGSSISAIILLGTIFTLSFFVGQTPIAVSINITVIILGISLGWIIGIIASPYSKKEQDQFTTLTKAVAVFISGYAVGKLDKIIDKLFDPDLAFESLHGFRLLAFLSALILAIVITFVYRQYVRLNRKTKNKSASYIGGGGDDDDDDDDDVGKKDPHEKTLARG